uniref:Uncharacterized protein n=2 Tax=Polaromonas sp. H1N TaxID=1840283 RepID=A0A2S1FIM0_9BURK|nr:hypothetical protein pH1NP1_p022 [Polaromonas sp. H1N]
MTALLRRVITGSAFVLIPHLCAAQHVVCGLGPPPGSSDFDSWSAKTEQQRQSLGYLLVCESFLDRYRYEAQIAGDTAVRRKLAFEPHGLDGSLFNSLEFLGSIADGFGDRGAAMYRRVFRGTEGEIITLQEFSLQGGASVRTTRDDGHLRLRGTDAQLSIVQAASGKGFAQLTWQEDSTYFEATIDRGLDSGRSKERLVATAASLPRYGQGTSKK